MQDILVIDNLQQLKCISDPFRIQLLQMLSTSEKTGQQIADELEIPRAKIHYHLRELEKNGLIEMVKTEQKHSIVQKFYAPTAKKLVPKIDLLSYQEEEPKKDKDKDSFPLQLNQADLTVFKKNLKKFLKKESSKSGDTNYNVSILPGE